MTCYEFVFILSQSTLSVDTKKILDDFIQCISDNGGEVIKKEDWGLRTLAYMISGCKKGYYFFIGFKSNSSVLAVINKKCKFKDSIIRHSIVKVEQISDTPSPILDLNNSLNDNSVDNSTIEKPNS